MTTRKLRPAAVWAILVAATLLSYATWLDIGRGDARLTGSIVIVIALAKAWLIGQRFMELDEATLPLRLVFAGWVIAVGVMLLAMFWLAA